MALSEEAGLIHLQGSRSQGQVSQQQEDDAPAQHTGKVPPVNASPSVGNCFACSHSVSQLPAGMHHVQGQSSRPIILITTVDIGEGRTSQIQLRDGDSPQVASGSSDNTLLLSNNPMPFSQGRCCTVKAVLPAWQAMLFAVPWAQQWT